MRAIFFLLIIAGSFTLAGCGGKKDNVPLTPDPSFSVNVMPVPPNWPRERVDWPSNEEHKVVQKGIYEKYDKPDFIRYVYTFDARFVTSEEMQQWRHMVGKRPEPLVEWVFLDEEKVYRFDGKKEPVDRELEDKLRVICMEGDPQKVTNVAVHPEEDMEKEIWFYYTSGNEYHFIEDRKVSERKVSAGMPGSSLMRGDPKKY